MTFEDRYVKAGEFNVRYWRTGERGPTVILIHGIGASVEWWKYNIASLAKSGLRVFALDVVGFGRSDKPLNGYSLSLIPRFMADFVEALGLERTSLVGNSMGGLIALQCAVDPAFRAEKLVLVNSAGFGRESPLLFRLSSLPILGELLTLPVRPNIRRFQRLLFFDRRFETEEWVDLILDLAQQPGAQRAFLKILRAGVNLRGVRLEILQPLWEKIAELKAPTLIIWGKQDRLLPVSHAYVAHRMIAGSRLHIFERCGHMPQIEKASEFNQLVAEFLKG
ncbi:MAG: alpha/beta fold hydrolase [Anaerolineae bacterium]